MSEQAPQRSGQSQQSKQSQNQQGQNQQSQQSRSNPLQTERGNTSIQDSVVSQVSDIVAQEAEGIRMGGGASQRASGLFGSITGGSNGSNTQGVSVEVGQEEAAVDLTLMVELAHMSRVVSRAEEAA